MTLLSAINRVASVPLTLLPCTWMLLSVPAPVVMMLTTLPATVLDTASVPLVWVSCLDLDEPTVVSMLACVSNAKNHSNIIAVAFSVWHLS